MRLLRRKPRTGRRSHGRRSPASKWKQALRAGHEPTQLARLEVVARILFELDADLPVAEQIKELRESHLAENLLRWAWHQIRHDRETILSDTDWRVIQMWWNYHKTRRRPTLTPAGRTLQLVDQTTGAQVFQAAKHWRTHAAQRWHEAYELPRSSMRTADILSLAPLALSTPILRTKHGVWYQIQNPYDYDGPNPYRWEDRDHHPDVKIMKAVGEEGGHCYNSGGFARRFSVQGHPDHNERHLYQLYGDKDGNVPGPFIGALSIVPDGAYESEQEDSHNYAGPGTYVPMGYYGASLKGNANLGDEPKYWPDYWGMMEHIIGKIEPDEDGNLYIPKKGRDEPFLDDNSKANWHANHPHYTRLRKARLGSWLQEMVGPNSPLWETVETKNWDRALYAARLSWQGVHSTDLPGSVSHDPVILGHFSKLMPLFDPNRPPLEHGGRLYIPVDALLPSWWPEHSQKLIDAAWESAVYEYQRLPKNKPGSWPLRRNLPAAPPRPETIRISIPQGMKDEHRTTFVVVTPFPGDNRHPERYNLLHFLAVDPNEALVDLRVVRRLLMEGYYEAVLIALKSRIPEQLALAEQQARQRRQRSRQQRTERRPQVDTAQLETLVDSVLAANPDKVAEYRGGNQRAIGFLLGQVMRGAPGRADAQQVRALLTARLG